MAVPDDGTWQPSRVSPYAHAVAGKSMAPCSHSWTRTQLHPDYRQWSFEPSQTSIFPDFTFLHILKAYVQLIYPLTKFLVLILLNL